MLHPRVTKERTGTLGGVVWGTLVTRYYITRRGSGFNRVRELIINNCEVGAHCRRKIVHYVVVHSRHLMKLYDRTGQIVEVKMCGRDRNVV